MLFPFYGLAMELSDSVLPSAQRSTSAAARSAIRCMPLLGGSRRDDRDHEHLIVEQTNLNGPTARRIDPY